ncbi:hypothetical protein L6164_013047 [Bauhinia variegata]|uniref:Uncharacterized protein n=1 Tax=Bauhinia variegata TaxID=167791 RepID=A0ACB9PDF6_BAUVA|nr:hypothetical protein L6164_013047 [Bauhinia variegata]
MGVTISKNKRYLYEKDAMILKGKLKLLQEEVKGMVCERDKQSRRYERDIMVFTFKEADWKQERERLREEVEQLRKKMEEKEERIREMREALMEGENGGNEWESKGTKLLVEQMEEERARRDEAVEKWKQLYLTIKTELDDLIQRTYEGDGLHWKSEEANIQMENLQKKLQDKKETIIVLKAQLASIKQEKFKKEREFDLLKQSLRIMNGNKKKSVQPEEKLFKG